jgi:hypothetical protein
MSPKPKLMKKLLLVLLCSFLSGVCSYAAIGEHVQFSIYHNSSDSSNQFRIRMRTDTSSFWDSTSHKLTLFQVPIRFLDADGLSFTVSNSGLPFTSGNLMLLPIVNDPADADYSLRRLYYDTGSTSPFGSTWAKNTEYDLAIVTITAGTVSSDIQLPNQDSHESGIYTYLELNGSDYMANYTEPFYGDTLSDMGWEYASLPGSALPVALADFTASVENETDARLSWQTATEENNRGFYIERSIDGQNWEFINFTSSSAPGGNSDILVGYAYTDMNVYKSQAGINTYYYRIRQQDMNGEEEFVGGIKSVRFSGNAAAAKITVYPNPAASLVHVKVEGNAPSRCMIYDMSGRCVLNSDPAAVLDVSGLAKGMYQLTVTDIAGAHLGTQQLIIAR